MASIHKHILKDGTTVRWHAFWRDGSGKQHKRVFKRRRFKSGPRNQVDSGGRFPVKRPLSSWPAFLSGSRREPP